MAKRVLLVDDSEFVLSELAHILETDPEFEVVGTARHGLAAVDSAEALRPDVITLDVRMPIMDGVRALKHIMTRRPVATVMISAFTFADSPLTFDCMRYGAAGYLLKPGLGAVPSPEQYPAEFLASLRKALATGPGALRFWRMRSLEPGREGAPYGAPRRLVFITAGCSGIAPLLKTLNDMRPAEDCAVVVRLDMPQRVLTSFVSYAAPLTGMDVKLAAHDELLRAGTCYLVGPDKPALLLDHDGLPSFAQFEVTPGSTADGTLQALALSAAETFRERATGVVLSGTSGAAAESFKALLDRGGRVVVQRQQDCIEPLPAGLPPASAGTVQYEDPDRLASCAGAQTWGRV
jgi:two-component system chemotaxis response regulator CheB